MRLFLIILLIGFSSYSQSIRGRVISSSDSTALAGVTIQNLKGNEWAVTDENGQFSINLKGIDYVLEFKMLGKQTKYLEHKDIVNHDTIIIALSNEDLRLDEVMVTAVPKRAKIGSSVVFNEYAVDQVQSFSLGDILEQLPGLDIQSRYSPEPLNSAQSISLRTAQSSNTNAFGVAYILDGFRLSNDEDMQSYNYATGLTRYDNTSSGLDLRSIPASNIEDVEVISGVADAKYGNLTSGVIRINRKAGVTPLTANINVQQGNTSVSIGKGLKLNNQLGALSLSLDYLNANPNPSNTLDKYNRITAGAIWSRNTDKVRNTLSLTVHSNLDDKTYDKDLDDGGKDASFKKDIGFRLSNRLNWKPESGLVDNISLTSGLSYSYQHSYNQSFKNDGGRVVPTSLETGLFKGSYTPAAYLQIKEVYGQPINLNGQLTFNKAISYNSVTQHNLSFGVDAGFSENYGRGRGYNPENAHTQVTLTAGSNGVSSDEGVRPLDFSRYVKPRINLGLFAQDNVTHTFKNDNELYINLGLRFDVQNSFASYSPRVNLGYEINDKFSVRGGFGFASKAPSLNQIFPGDKYFDILIRDFRTSDYSFNLVQTYKKEIPKQNLEPSKSWKYEIGANYNTNFGSMSITAFYNSTYDGISSVSIIEPVLFPQVEFSFNEAGSPPTYEVTGYEDLLLDYSLSQNSNQTLDKGVEFFFNFNKIKAINTSFNLSGTYIFSSSTSRGYELKKNTDVLEETYLYGLHYTQPNENDIIKLRGTATHHLSKLGLLISLTAEQYTRGVTYASSDSVYPYAYINPQGDIINIPAGQRTADRFKTIQRSPASTEKRSTPAYHNFNLRLTKEMLNGLSLSLYANNFLNYRPLISTGGSESRQNSLISFGGQIRYKF